MASQTPNQQGTSPIDNAQHDDSQSRFPGAAFCWRLMNSLKTVKKREEVARWSFRFASKRKRGTAFTYRKKEKQTNLEVINEERNIVADRFVLNPPANDLNQMAAHITPQKKKAPEPAPVPTPAPLVFPPEPMPIGPTGINWGRIPSLNADSLRNKIQTKGEDAQNSLAHLFEEQERRRASRKYWLDMAKKRKREEEDAQWEKAEEDRVKRVARLKTNPFADLYFPKPKSQRQQQQQSTPQVSRTQPRMQTSIRPQSQLMPNRVKSIQNRWSRQPANTARRSGRMVVTNSGSNTRRWKCAVCCQTMVCTRHRIYWKGNYEMIDLCLVCELRKKRGDILNYVKDNFSDLDFDDSSSSTTNTDTSSNSDCVMVDVVNVDGQNNAQPAAMAAAGGVNVQVQVDSAVVNASGPVVIVVPNVQQNVQSPVPAAPAPPTLTYRDMFWRNNPLRQLFQQAASIDYSSLFRVFVFGQPYLQVNVGEQQQQPQQQPQQQQTVQNVQPAQPVAAAPADPAAPEARHIARQPQRRVQPPRQARAAQAAQSGQARQRQQIAIPISGARPAGIRRARTAHHIPRVDPQDPRLFFGFLA